MKIGDSAQFDNSVFKIQNIQTVNKQDTFGDMLKTAVGDVNSLQNQADSKIQKLVSGEEVDIHGSMIAMQKAEISLQLVMQVRNKIVSAYDEIVRMQV